MRKLLILLCLIFSFKNYGQSSLKKDSIAISNYIKAQKLLNKKSEILSITDSKWINLITSYTNSKQKLDNNKRLKKLKKKSISERFEGNDPAVDFEIISIIKTEKNDSIKKLFSELISFDSKPKLIGNELKSLLFESINNPELETSTAILISNLKIDGFEKIIEDKVLSGKSVDEIALFYCLSDSDMSKTIDYFTRSFLNEDKYPNGSNLFTHRLIKSLNQIIYNAQGNEVLKEKSLNLCVELLNKYPITQKFSSIPFQSREPFLTGTDSLDQLGILYILIKHNDKRVIPFLKLLKNIGVRDNIQFDYLFWKFGEDKSEITFNKLLSDYQYYYSVVYELDHREILLNNDDLMIKVLSNFDKTPTFSGSESQIFVGWNIGHVRNLMTVFYKLEKSKFATVLNSSIKSPDDKDLFMKIYDLYNRSSVDSYILDQKLRANSSNKYDNFDSGVHLSPVKIGICNSFLNDLKMVNSKPFDIASYVFENEIPNDFKALLNIIENNSNNELRNISCFFDTKYFKQNDENFNHKFESNCYIMLNNIVYFVKLNDKTNRQKLIINLSDKLLNDKKSSNRFVELDLWKVNYSTIYAFGNPETIHAILNKYDFKN